MVKRIISIIFAGVIIIGVVSGCAESNKEGDSIDSFTSQKGETAVEYIKISPQEAKNLMDSQDAIVVDVRTPSEYEQGHIEGSILVPENQIGSLATEMLPDKDALILVYCRSGNRSASASGKLISMGYTNVKDFGGINDWPYEIVQ